MATPTTASDMADFFDFGEAAMPEVPQDVFIDVPTAQTNHG